MMNYGYGYGHSWFGGEIIMIIFWALLIAGVIALVKYFIGNDSVQKSSSSALDILKERYAKGEIEKEEFESKKKDLI